MIRIHPGDIVQLVSNSKYYFAYILSSIQYFGGNLTYALHYTSSTLISPEELLLEYQPGFHAFIDFIQAKRENRIERIMNKADFSLYENMKYLKSPYWMPPDPPFAWSIIDENFKEIRKVKELSDEEKMYPYTSRIDDLIMINRIEAKWVQNMTSFPPYKTL